MVISSSDYDKRLFKTKKPSEKSGLSISYIRLVISRLKESGFIRVYNRNSRYTLFERV